MSRTDIDPATLARSLRGMAGDGSIEWVHGPMQTSVLLDVADALDENARLRELVRDMWPHVRNRSRMCRECELTCDTSDECLLYEPMRQRMRGLGIEFDE